MTTSFNSLMESRLYGLLWPVGC